MIKELPVAFTVNETEVVIPVSYRIDMSGNVQTLTCWVGASSPAWLAIRKFEYRSIMTDGLYTPIFEDNNQAKNINVVMFLDKVFEEVMEFENCPIEV